MKRSSCKNETESHCSEAIGKGMQIGTENKKNDEDFLLSACESGSRQSIRIWIRKKEMVKSEKRKLQQQ